MWLTRIALRNPIFILMACLMVVVLGAVSLSKLSVDLFPDITIPVIRVATFYTGAGPADIEKSITEPVERAVSATPGVDRVESFSKQGVSVVSVWFSYGTNLDNAQFEVSQRVSQILNTLPPGIQQPFIIKFDITNIPIAQVVVDSPDMDERDLRDLTYNVIEPQLERITGVASATVGGGKDRQVQVMANAGSLRARGLALLDVVSAVNTSNLLLPSGNLREGARDYNVFSNTQFELARGIGDVIVKPGDPGFTAPVRVSDVATVVDGVADQTEIVRINGHRGVFLRVLKQPGANTIAVVDALKAAIPKLRGVPATTKVTVAFDQSTYIRSAVAALEHEAVQGGLFAAAVILVFLASLRATGIIAVAIPLSVVATFVLLYFTGQTLNVFTLGGLALAVGRLVDDSIVELENIHRHLALGQDRKSAVLAAAQEVAMPIFVSTITTIVVFFPVLFLTGVARNLFLPLALTISFALMASFLVSRTVTPLLCQSWLRSEHPTKGLAHGILAFFDRMDELYARSLRWVLKNRAVTIVAILVLAGGTIPLAKKVGTEFFPDTDESQFSITYRTPIGTRVEKTEGTAKRIEELSRASLDKGTPPGKSPILTLLSDSGLPVGRTAIFTTNTGPHSGSLQVMLVGRGNRGVTDIEAAEKVRAALRDNTPGTQIFFFTGGIVKRIVNFGSAAPIDVEILGYDLDAGMAFAKRLFGKMRELRDLDGAPLLTDLQISREENYPELDIVVDREKAGVLALSEQQIAQSVLASLVGSTQFAPTQMRDPKTGNPYYINVRLDDPFRSHVSDLSDVLMRSPKGSLVTLDTVASIKRGGGPVVINRKYLQRIVDVTANVAPTKDLGKATRAVESVVRDLQPPEGFTVGLSGQSLAQKQAFAGLGFAALLAILLVYMVLASQFGSLLDPLVIMMSVPLGVSGVFLMLWATKTTLSVNSFMGIIMMIGIVVSNGVLLVDFANVLRDRGEELIEATVRAGKTRLRPILMTTIATIVGLAPMAAGIGEGSETNLPLARAVIGGLAVSTVLTLFLVPALYSLFERFSRGKHHATDDDGGGGTELAA